MRMFGTNSEIRSTEKWEKGKKGGRENGGRNGMLLVRICWGPARSRFAGSGGFGFRILDFEFVWDFDIGISDFPFWLRPRAALE